jgi:hypothetical protein
VSKNKKPHSDSENGKDEPDAEFVNAASNSRELGRRIGFILRALGPTAARIAFDVLTDNDGGGE